MAAADRAYRAAFVAKNLRTGDRVRTPYGVGTLRTVGGNCVTVQQADGDIRLWLFENIERLDAQSQSAS